MAVKSCLLVLALFTMSVFAAAHRPLVVEKRQAFAPTPSMMMGNNGAMSVDMNGERIDGAGSENGKLRTDGDQSENGKPRTDAGTTILGGDRKGKTDGSGTVKTDGSIDDMGGRREKIDGARSENGKLNTNGDQSQNGKPRSDVGTTKANMGDGREHEILGGVDGARSENGKLGATDSDKGRTDDMGSRREKTGWDEKVDGDGSNPVRPVVASDPMPQVPGGSMGFRLQLGPIGFGGGWQFGGIPGAVLMPFTQPYVVVSPYSPPSVTGYGLRDGYYLPSGGYAGGVYYSDHE